MALEPDRGSLARSGLTATDFSTAVAREVRGAVGGTKLDLEGEEITVTVKAKGAQDRSRSTSSKPRWCRNADNAPIRI